MSWKWEGCHGNSDENMEIETTMVDALSGWTGLRQCGVGGHGFCPPYVPPVCERNSIRPTGIPEPVKGARGLRVIRYGLNGRTFSWGPGLVRVFQALRVVTDTGLVHEPGDFLYF